MLVQRHYIITINGETFYSNTLRAALDCVARWSKPLLTEPLNVTIERNLKDLPDDNI